MNLLNLVATLTLEDSQYRQALGEDSKAAEKSSKKTEAATKKTVRAFLKYLAIIIAVTAAFVKLTKNAIDYGNSVNDNSKAMGMSAEAYQKWLLAAESVGASQEDLNSSMSSLNDLLTEASNGGADAIITLSKLGLSYDDLKDKSPDERMRMVITALQGMADGAEKTRLEQEIFGSSSTALSGLLSDQSESVDTLFGKFEDLGLVMSDEDVKASDALNTQMKTLKIQLDAAGNSIATMLYPIVKELADLLSFAVEKFHDMPDWLQNLIVVLGVLTAGVIALGIAWNAGFGWLTLIIDAIGALIIGILELWKNWDTVSRWLSDSWQKVANFFIKVGNGIADFFKGLWEGIVAGFKAFVNFFIDGLNVIIRALNKIAIDVPDWIPNIGGQHWGINIPLIARLQRGKDFIPNDMFPAYLDYGERVLTRKENEQYSALGGASGVETLINGLSQAVRSQTSKQQGDVKVYVQIGDKDFKSFTYKTVNSSMKQKGLKSLRKVGGYGD